MHPDVLSLPPIMALTRDGIGLSHADQARALVDAGVRWIQLRVKNASLDAWLVIARDVVSIAHGAGAIVTINDRVDVAVASGADGAHLGVLDGDWVAARALLGHSAILGGTVHNADEARRASASGVLDYVGVGPLRFTATKQDIAPVLGIDGIVSLLAILSDLPAWAIGGIVPGDLPALRSAGLRGVAVSSAMFSDNTSQYDHFLSAWNTHDTQDRNAHP